MDEYEWTGERGGERQIGEEVEEAEEVGSKGRRGAWEGWKATPRGREDRIVGVLVGGSGEGA